MTETEKEIMSGRSSSGAGLYPLFRCGSGIPDAVRDVLFRLVLLPILEVGILEWRLETASTKGESVHLFLELTIMN